MGNRPDKAAPKKALVAISLRFASSRDVLMGIFRHIETLPNWSVSLVQPEENPLTVEKVHAAEQEGALGMIVTEVQNDELMRALAETRLPVVTVGIRSRTLASRRGPTVFVNNDNAAVGDMGARHFIDQGRFNSYGFVHAGAADAWAEERGRAFLARIEASAPDAETSSYPAAAAPDSPEDAAALESWLAALPKPAAVMAACDWRAVQVLSVCGRANISVPSAVAVLGVDNDEFLCEHVSPPLSSVLPGHVEMGRLAAKSLERLVMRGNGRRHVALTVPPSTVVVRESTRMRAPSAVLVDKAKRFIQANAVRGISVNDVVAHLGASRRLVEMRWREATGETIRSSIEAVRLAKLRRLLASTRRPVAVIAAECGYRDPDMLAHIFRKRFGMTMSEWRKVHRSAAGSAEPEGRATPSGSSAAQAEQAALQGHARRR